MHGIPYPAFDPAGFAAAQNQTLITEHPITDVKKVYVMV